MSNQSGKTPSTTEMECSDQDRLQAVDIGDQIWDRATYQLWGKTTIKASEWLRHELTIIG